MGLSAAALLAVPGTVLAQFPPEPPATFYGSAVGASAAQGVVAIVINGATSTVCGSGVVQNDASGPVYVVDVVSDSQRAGCGRSGRQVRFYFTPSGATGGKMASESGTWDKAGPKLQNLTLGAPLGIRLYGTLVASDKSN